ncbi:hypothetical protein MKX01_021761 [Papaver californicum]|nr:hypothetical protein MKX01_021761 [Papaver californicum]
MLNRCVAKKRRYTEISNEKHQEEIKVYNFKVLLPNGTSVGLTLEQPGDEMHINEFLELVKVEHKRTLKDFDSSKSRRKIFWNNESVYLEDATGYKIRYKILFCRFLPKICHFLTLNDGKENTALSYENMWDLTPDTDLLTELPESYTFVTALANLIDNSLQAVWSNNTNERKMISVTVDEARISIFDTGPGMDETEENSIAKWGKMCASLHRLCKRQAIGGKPPYLKPFFGMFGYGGLIASMHIGRHTVVSSKRKESKKVYDLHLKREALLHGSGGASWKTGGGLRDPLEDEKKSSPHGSFTKVDIFKPKQRPMDVFKLQCRLKDIYFPYIQCDELTIGKTSRPVEFQVNGEDLAEIEGGEVAITNLHSCNGPELSLQVHFSDEQSGTLKSPGLRAVEANARLKCVYFPVYEGKETFPDARWPRLPFMELKHRKGDKAQLLKRCCLRVKCFIVTDAGFNPTPSKTDLAQHHRFTTALKNIGSKLLEKDDGITVEIRRDQKSLSLSQLEKEYEDWILQMHDAYDKELSCGQDPPILVVHPSNKKGLRITSVAVSVHKFIKRKGESWKAGDLIKIIPLNKQKIIYATLEFILLEGFQGKGEAHLICRPIDLPAEKGCLLVVDGENSWLDVRDSLSFPINVIDCGQCSKVDAVEWKHQLGRWKLKAPSTIDLGTPQQCQQLKIDRNIIAVIRPASFTSSDDLEMSMEVKCAATYKNIRDEKHIFSERVRPSSRKGFHGLYIFSLVGSCFPPLAIACYDKYDNHMPFMSIPELDVAINMNGTVILPVEKLKVELLSDNMILQISDILIESGELDKIRPQYEASLGISCSHDKLISLAIPFFVFPGSLQSVKAFIPDLEKQWLPGDVIKEMLLEVDAEGCINLNGILKVTGSFGKTVSFSVEYEGQLLLKNEIQIGERELRIMSTLPDNCAAGSLIENIIFEVVDSNGTVDETIHDVNVTQYPKMEANLVEHDTVPFQSPGGKMVVFQKEPVSALWTYNLNDMKKKEDDVKRIGSLIKVQENNLKLLTEEKASIENEISDCKMNASPDLYGQQTNCHMHDFVADKEVVIKQIEMSNTAACVWCNIPADIQSQKLPDIVGIVALLGSVSTESLTRMLAKYLGEELMLAVVCKSYAAARFDRTDGLHIVAAQLGRPINCGFLVICLEDLCPYGGKFKSDDDPQKKLSLVDPVLANGEIPSGFLGHAVNMVNIDIQQLHTRTNKGYYLRETLFYLLFGELQHGAISLDGGIVKSNGILSLGPRREPEVRFPVVTLEGQLQIAPNIKDTAKQIEKKRLELGEISVKFNKVSKEHGKTKKRFGKKMQQLERQYDELRPLLKESFLGGNCAMDNPILSGTSVTDNWEEEDST